MKKQKAVHVHVHEHDYEHVHEHVNAHDGVHEVRPRLPNEDEDLGLKRM